MRVVITVALCMAGGVAWGGAFTISPVRIDLSSEHRVQAVALRNEADNAVVIQAKPFEWSQHEEQEDRLDPTQDLIVTPPVFTLTPKGQQIVRIALRHEGADGRELDYRVLFDEVPSSSDPSQVRMRLRLSVPAFVYGHRGETLAPAMRWRAAWPDQGTLAVTACNAGAGHLHVIDMEAQPSGSEALQHVSPAYVLPGACRVWRFEAKTAGDHSGRVLIRGRSDRGPFSSATNEEGLGGQGGTGF